jgi:uncharacterized integral membrane protein
MKNVSIGGVLTILFLVLLTLKLTSIVTWSWWFITAPLWLVIVILISSICLGTIIFGWDAMWVKVNERKNRRNKHNEEVIK